MQESSINIKELDAYIINFKNIEGFNLKNKKFILYVVQESQRLDINNQIYYIQGASSVDMVNLRRYIMSTNVPSIDKSFDVINTSDYENVVNTFAISQIPIKITGDKWHKNKIGKIVFRLVAVNSGDNDIYISTLDKNYFYVEDDQGYDIEIQENFYICSLGVDMVLNSYYTCSINLPFCNMFIYKEINVKDEGLFLPMYKITMKSIPYDLIEILEIKDIIENSLL